MGRPSNIFPILVNVLSGLFVGYSVGFPAVYMTYMRIATDCTLPSSELACTTLGSHANCAWNSTTTSCEFSDHVNCSVLTHSLCSSSPSSSCHWDYEKKNCAHFHGWTTVQEGSFASSIIVGGFVGAFSAGPLVEARGHKYAMFFFTVLNVLGCGLCHLTRYLLTFVGFIVANILIGVGVGALQVVPPMYVAEVSTPEEADRVGLVLQVALTFGIVFAAGAGYAMQPSTSPTATPLNMEWRFQFFIGLMTFFGIIMFPLVLKMRASRLFLQSEENRNNEKGTQEEEEGENGGEGVTFIHQDGLHHIEDNRNKQKGTFVEKYCSKSTLKYMLVATWLSGGIQLTGINSIMVYGPKIMKRVGLSALAGNLAIDGWNFVATIFTLFIVKRFRPRQMYLAGLAVVTCCCVLAGVVVYPGVMSDGKLKQGLAGLAIFGFIAGFEMGMGGPFYVLAQMLFPLNVRGFGTGYTIGVNYIFNIVINFAFPAGVVFFSGGPSADQDRGIAIWFLLFAGIGIFSTVILTMFMKPATESGVYAKEVGEGQQAPPLP